MATVKLLDPNDARRRLDRYELIGEIAAGGMATVYLARLAGVGGFQRFVAIKRLHPHLANEQEFVEMFLDEARLAAGIHHPHVVPILEVGTSDSGYYLVMEYIEGDTLARIVARALSKGGSVPRSVLLRILLDSLAGLGAAHGVTDASGALVQLVHRDCSPQNILVGSDGTSRLTDFGVARASSRLSTTRAERLKGKIAYMSPEQAKGTDLDHRADLFSMGIVLWEVLAGRRLFKAESEAGTLSRVLIEPIPALTTISPDIHPALGDVVMRALDRDPNARFQSAAEMADALETAAREGATSGDVGVASPREVAAYVQRVLGQEIAAQRESVRAWLSQSDPQAPLVRAPSTPPKAGPTLVSRSDPPPPPSPKVDVRVLNGGPKPPFDVTVKLPLDRKTEPGPGHALPLPLPPLVARPPVSAIVAPPSPSPQSPHAMHALVDSERESAVPSSGGTIVGLGRSALGPPPVPPAPPPPPSMSGENTDPDAGAAIERANAELNDLMNEVENDQDTLLMVRSDTNLSAAVNIPEIPRPPPSAPISDPMPFRQKRFPRAPAVILGLVLMLGAVILVVNLVGGPSSAGPTTPTPTPTNETVAPPPTPTATQAIPTPTSTTAPAPTMTAAPTADARPTSAPTSEPKAPRHGSHDPAPPKTSAPTTAQPPPPPPPPPVTAQPPPPPPPSDDLSNPYR